MDNLYERTICWHVLSFFVVPGRAWMLLELSIERAKTLKKWGQLGPALLTEVLRGVHPSGFFGCQEQFYPTHWLEAHTLWLKGYAPFVHSRLEGAFFLHLWNSVLTKMGISLDYRPTAGSFFEELIGDRNVLGETREELHAAITQKIRFILDWKPNYRVLYEEKMGLDWEFIYSPLD